MFEEDRELFSVFFRNLLQVDGHGEGGVLDAVKFVVDVTCQ